MKKNNDLIIYIAYTLSIIVLMVSVTIYSNSTNCWKKPPVEKEKPVITPPKDDEGDPIIPKLPKDLIALKMIEPSINSVKEGFYQTILLNYVLEQFDNEPMEQGDGTPIDWPIYDGYDTDDDDYDHDFGDGDNN